MIERSTFWITRPLLNNLTFLSYRYFSLDLVEFVNIFYFFVIFHHRRRLKTKWWFFDGLQTDPLWRSLKGPKFFNGFMNFGALSVRARNTEVLQRETKNVDDTQKHSCAHVKILKKQRFKGTSVRKKWQKKNKTLILQSF